MSAFLVNARLSNDKSPLCRKCAFTFTSLNTPRSFLTRKAVITYGQCFLEGKMKNSLDLDKALIDVIKRIILKKAE